MGEFMSCSLLCCLRPPRWQHILPFSLVLLTKALGRSFRRRRKFEASEMVTRDAPSLLYLTTAAVVYMDFVRASVRICRIPTEGALHVETS